MESAEERLKELILTKYKSIREFTNSIDMPYSTFDSILKRGISNSNITNVLRISNALGIDTEELANGKIIPKQTEKPHTLAAHFEGDDFTEEEMADIQAYAEFVKNRRKTAK